MRRNSAKFKILNLLKGQGWTHSGDIQKTCILDNWGYTPDYIKRECRKLENEGWIEKDYNKKGHVIYKLVRIPFSLKEPSEMSDSELRVFQ